MTVYRCPAGERLKYYYTNVENGLKLRRYWTSACRTCVLKAAARQECNAGSTVGARACVGGCTAGARPGSASDATPTRDGRASLWYDQGPHGRNPLLMKTLPRVAAEMALHVLAYNLTRAINALDRTVRSQQSEHSYRTETVSQYDDAGIGDQSRSRVIAAHARWFLHDQDPNRRFHSAAVCECFDNSRGK